MPYTYRKTVATMLDRQGLSARNIADQLGHARISMTQDVYMGRRAVDQAAAVYWKASHHRDMTEMTSRLPYLGVGQSLECGFFWRSNGTVK